MNDSGLPNASLSVKYQRTILIGIIFLLIEVAIFIYWITANPSFASKIFSMVAANHVGGRLPFIAVGLEQGLSSHVIIPIIIFYNTTYLLLMYSLFVSLSERIKKIKIIRRYVKSFQNEAKRKRSVLRKWNWFSLSVFVWIPLPWTGAAVGSYIAHLEGYSTKETLLTVLPSMWIGVISWTLWFDELYEFIEGLGKGKTMAITIFLLILPVVLFILNNLKKKLRSIKS